MKTTYFNAVALFVLAVLTIGTGYGAKKALTRAEAVADQALVKLTEFDRHLAAVETRIGEIKYRDTSALTECGTEIGRLKQRIDTIKDGVLKPGRHARSGR